MNTISRSFRNMNPIIQSAIPELGNSTGISLLKYGNNIKWLRLLLNNNLVFTITKYALSTGIVLILDEIANFASKGIKKFFGFVPSFIINKFLTKVRLGGGEILNGFFKLYHPIPVEEIRKVLARRGINGDGLHFIGGYPIIVQFVNTTQFCYVDISYSNYLSRGYYILMDECEKFYFNRFEKRNNVGSKYPFDVINCSNGNITVSNNEIITQSVFVISEYRETQKMIKKYLSIQNTIGINMPPLVIVYKGPPGVGKSLFLDYMQNNYNITCSKYMISNKQSSLTKIDLVFDTLLSNIRWRNTDINNIDELDKVYHAFINIIDDSIKSKEDYFLDSLFMFINS